MPFYIILYDENMLNEIIGDSKTTPLKIKKHLFISNGISRMFYENLGENERLMILKNSRSLEKAEIDYEDGIFNLGSLTLVAYEPLKDISANRAIYRLIKRAPCFKASSLIYLFPYIDYDNYVKSRIVSPNILIKKIMMYGGKVISASRLKLVYPRSGKRLIEDLRISLIKRVDKLNEMLYNVKEPRGDLKMKYLIEIKTEIKTLREIVKVYSNEMNIDLKVVTSKLINTAKIVNQLIDGVKEGKEL